MKRVLCICLAKRGTMHEGQKAAMERSGCELFNGDCIIFISRTAIHSDLAAE